VATAAFFIGLCVFVSWYIFYYKEVAYVWTLYIEEDYPAPSVRGFGCAALGESVYLSGGETPSQVLSRTLKFNYSNYSWNTVASLPIPMYGHILKPYRQYLFSFGGIEQFSGASLQTTNVVYRYDPENDKWD